MKKIIFFDLDQTIYNNDLNLIPTQTGLLLEKLASMPNITLGLATGRSLGMLDMIQPYVKFFEYFVLVNGGVVFHKDQIIFEHPIDHVDIKDLIIDAQASNIILGMVAARSESITQKDQRISFMHTGLQTKELAVNQELYLTHPIFQLWLIADHKEDLLLFSKRHPKFQLYFWRRGGADFIYKTVNKGTSIKKLMDSLDYDQLICVGDGENDHEMIEIADIGIVMDNAKSKALKEKADLIAPHIDADQLYDFFIQNKLI